MLTPRSFIILVLIIAGETIFLLPFVVARVFRPTFLDVFQISNFQLGSAFSVYGLVAMVSYFAGGPLADRYSNRKLMAIALAVTAGGGVVFSTIPSLVTLTILFGFWGLSTILLFWAALLRATRVWGGVHQQGTAYGMLDGGRGLVAAVIAGGAVYLFGSLLPQEAALASLDEKKEALTQIIWVFTCTTAAVGGMIWWLLPRNEVDHREYKMPLQGFGNLIGRPVLWFHAIIVLCAYMGYKATDDFSLYARDAFGHDDLQAARVGLFSFWVRPFAAVIAGLVADRYSSSMVTILAFVVLIFGCLMIVTGCLNLGVYYLLILTVITTSLGIYALRGVYFALLQEAGIPLAITGLFIGVVSFVGYMPDVFMGPLMGYLIDRSPGVTGHQHVFAVVAGFACLGLISTLLFRKFRHGGGL